MTYLELVEDYAVRTGLSVETIIEQAIEDWVATTGAALLEATPKSNVIHFPVVVDQPAVAVG
jgi:hypothetical protein